MGRIETAYCTDIGYRHHVNQDAGGAWSWNGGFLLVVADGVSAGRRSEEASRQATATVLRRVAPLIEAQAAEREIAQALDAAIAEAHRQIAARPHERADQADASTVVAAYGTAEWCGGAWVGDSRAYLARGSAIAQLTADHSWAAEVVRRGLMEEEEAAADPRAHVILRWLGPAAGDDPSADRFSAVLEPGDTVICCSDGLSMYFCPPYGGPPEIAEIITHAPNLAEAMQALVATALRRGGADNITVAAARVGL